MRRHDFSYDTTLKSYNWSLSSYNALLEYIRNPKILCKSIRTHLFFELDFDPFGACAPAETEPEPVQAATAADEELLFEQATIQAPVEEMSNLEMAAPGMFNDF